jgi:hypothetical protein
MKHRRIAALVIVAAAVALHARCREGATTTSRSAASAVDPARRADLLALAAAAAQLQRLDVTSGPLRMIGRTVDSEGLPIRGAQVTLNGTRTTTSGADGLFAFDHLADDRYELVAEKGELHGEDSDHLTAQDVEPETVVLRDGPTFVIHVVDEAGLPVLGAKVADNFHNDAYTDRDGMLRRRGMDYGTDRITVSADGYATEERHVDLGDDPRRTVEQRFELHRAQPIGGLVLDQDGKAVPDAHVLVALVDHMWSDGVEVDAGGHWTARTFGRGKVTSKRSRSTTARRIAISSCIARAARPSAAASSTKPATPSPMRRSTSTRRRTSRAVATARIWWSASPRARAP